MDDGIGTSVKMSSHGKGSYCIALQDLPLIKDEGQSSWTRIKEKAKEIANLTGPTHLLKGELIIVHDEGVGDYVRGRSATDLTKRIVCKKMYLSHLTDSQYHLLAPVKLPDRLALINNQQALYAIKKLKPDDKTWVTIPSQQYSASVLPGSTCHRATIRYIGEIQGEVGWYFGVELQDPVGTCDGSFKDERYFLCKDKYGAFLPAFHLNVTLKTQGRSSANPAKGSVLLEVNKSFSGQEFCEDDKVAVFDEEGKRITGKVKWAYPEPVGRKYYLIGIETDYRLKCKIEGHVAGYSHLFDKRDYKNHTYLAVPETIVLKDESTPVDDQDSSLRDFEVAPKSDDCLMRKSICSTASEIVQRENVPTKAFVDEQFEAVEEAEKQKLAKDFGVEKHDFWVQLAAKKELGRQQEVRDHDRKYQEANFGQDKQIGIPETSTYNPPENGHESNMRRKSDERPR